STEVMPMSMKSTLACSPRTRAMSFSKQKPRRTSASPRNSPCCFCSSAWSSCSFETRPLRSSKAPRCERGSFSKKGWSRRAGRMSPQVSGFWPRGLRGRPESGLAGRNRLLGEHELPDLDPVQGCAFAQVVAGDEEREAVLGSLVAPDAADQCLVAARGEPGRGEVLEPDRRRSGRQPTGTAGAD